MSNPAEVLGESCPERARYHHHSHLALKQSQVSVGLSFRFVLLACYRFPPKVVLTSEWVQQRPSPSEGSGIRRVHPAPGSPVRNRNGSRQHEAPARLGLFKPAGPSPRLPTSWEEQARGRGGACWACAPSTDRPQETSDLWAKDRDPRCPGTRTRSVPELPGSGTCRALSGPRSAGCPTPLVVVIEAIVS